MIVQESHVGGVTIKFHGDYYKDLIDEAIQKNTASDSCSSAN